MLTKGQTVYLMPTGNMARRGDRDRIDEGLVVVVGRKYYTVTVGSSREYKFDKATLSQIHNCVADYILYENKQDLLDRYETSRLNDKMYNVFNRLESRKLPLQKLRRIAAIIDEGE